MNEQRIAAELVKVARSLTALDDDRIDDMSDAISSLDSILKDMIREKKNRNTKSISLLKKGLQLIEEVEAAERRGLSASERVAKDIEVDLDVMDEDVAADELKKLGARIKRKRSMSVYSRFLLLLLRRLGSGWIRMVMGMMGLSCIRVFMLLKE